MKSKTNSFILYACLAILVLLGAAAVKSFFVEPAVFTNIERIREIRDDSISYWRDKFGREHAQKEMAQAGLSVIQSVYGPIIDSVLTALNIQGKQLQQLTLVGLQNSNTVSLKVDTVFLDSSQHYNFSYQDRWIDLDGRIGKDSYLNYSTFDSLVITGYIKKYGFLGLGRRETMVDVYSINPHSKISGLQGISIQKERAKRFGLGPYAGFGWNGRQWSISGGIALTYDILKF
jgi:hypothetical protein